MPNKQQSCDSSSHTIWRAARAALALAIMCALTGVFAQSAQAQTFRVIHTFTGGADGASPAAGLTMDAAGDLYGTTCAGGHTGSNCGSPLCGNGCGTVFKLKHFASNWVLNPLYSFVGNDGQNPEGRVALAPDGTLYGTTYRGGGGGCGVGCGIVFQLRPSAADQYQPAALVPWNEAVLYRFTGLSDGAQPQGDLTFDQLGKIYGTAQGGGNGLGVIYELTPSEGGWAETVLYSVQDRRGSPTGGVIFDSSGNLYGANNLGGQYDDGAVYQLSPSGSGWTEQNLYSFTGGTDGWFLWGGLMIDSSGNLYGTTSAGGSGGGGTVFELTPSSGGWNFTTLYGLPGTGLGGGPFEKLVMDAAGNLYGTSTGGGKYGYGTVFKLTPSSGGWTYTSLYDFACGPDGGYPISNLVFDANGNLYGTTYECGVQGSGGGFGVVFEITP